MTKLAPGMPPLPARFRKLPVDPRGYPVPKFVYQKDDGTYDFRVIEPGWVGRCVRNRLCWLCGDRLGKFMTAVVGPMCVINRNSAEPPSHRDCAEFAARACPFLRFPNRKRDTEGLPEDGFKAGGEVAAIQRNPGVTALYTMTDYKARWVDSGGGNKSIMITLGEPVDITWWAHGRTATREEIVASIDSGLPLLRAMAEKEGKEAIAELEKITERGLKLVPA